MSNHIKLELTPAELILVPASKHWGMIMTLGILMIVPGTVGFFQPLGLHCGDRRILRSAPADSRRRRNCVSFQADGWPGMTSGVVLAGLFILTGVLMLMHPILSGLSLTLVIAAFLIAAGAAKCWLGFTHRERHGWGWIVANGAMSILLGILIFGGFPGSGLWVIGLFLAIEMIFDGWGGWRWPLPSARLTSSAMVTTKPSSQDQEGTINLTALF